MPSINDIVVKTPAMIYREALERICDDRTLDVCAVRIIAAGALASVNPFAEAIERGKEVARILEQPRFMGCGDAPPVPPAPEMGVAHELSDMEEPDRAPNTIVWALGCLLVAAIIMGLYYVVN